MGFTEVIFQDTALSLEFMVDIDIDSKKVIDCYTYKADLEEAKNNPYGEFNSYKKIRWKPGTNPLFVHNKNAFRTICKTSVVCPENKNEWDLLHEAMEANDIVTFEILEPCT